MNINDFKYVTTIAELKSFTNAAKQLYIAQPSLSQRIKHIEDEYGIIIFIRDSKAGVQITNDGEKFIGYAKQILQIEDSLRNDIAETHKTNDDVLRVGCAPMFLDSYLFDDLIRLFYGKYPKVKFEFVQKNSSGLQKELLANNIDIAVCYHPTISDGIEYETIYSDRYVLIPAAKGTLAQTLKREGIAPYTAIDPKLLKDEPLAVADKGTSAYNFITEIAALHDVELNIKHFSRSYKSLYNIAKVGIATGIAVESLFDPSLEHEPFYYFDTEHDALSLAVMWNKNKYIKSNIRDFIEVAASLKTDVTKKYPR